MATTTAAACAIPSTFRLSFSAMAAARRERLQFLGDDPALIQARSLPIVCGESADLLLPAHCQQRSSGSSAQPAWLGLARA
jgi:hypothetical protein